MTSRQRSFSDEAIFDAWQAELQRSSGPTSRFIGFLAFREMYESRESAAHWLAYYEQTQTEEDENG